MLVVCALPHLQLQHHHHHHHHHHDHNHHNQCDSHHQNEVIIATCMGLSWTLYSFSSSLPCLPPPAPALLTGLKMQSSDLKIGENAQHVLTNSCDYEQHL